MSDIRRLLSLFGPHVPEALVAGAAMLVVSLCTALVVYLFGPLFDQVLTPDRRAVVEREVGVSGAGKTLAGAQAARRTAPLRFLDRRLADLEKAAGVTPAQKAIVLPALVFLAFLLKNVFAYVAEYRFNAVGLAFVRDLRRRVYESILRQSESFFGTRPSGDLVARVTGDVDRLQSLFATDLADLVQSVATLASLLLLVVSLSPELTAAALVVAPAIVIPVVLIARRLRRLSRQARDRIGALTGVLSETIRGRRVVQAYGAEAYESARFESENELSFRLSKGGARVMALASPLVETASVLAFVLLLVWAGKRIEGGSLTFGTFVSFAVGLAMMYQPFKRATRINLALQHALASARRVFEVLDAPVAVVDAPDARPMEPFRQAIRFEGVSFRYPGGETDVLSAIDLTLERGTVTALVGPSGAGKTTLANLLPRFLDPSAGRILVDGTDLRTLTLRSLRGAIGLVTQDVVLFDDTVRRNVAYGRTDVSETRLREALRAANADAFVGALPAGLDAPVGESGSRLSGGQRQRLAIARALVKDPPILVLDEATSALDTESERAVQEALERLMAGRTVLVIAHRLSTVRRADRIVALDAGRIVEAGTHDELLARRGLYRRLYDLQSFGPEREDA